MTSPSDAFLRQWLLANGVVDAPRLTEAVRHRDTRMPKASLAQALLSLGIVSQDLLSTVLKAQAAANAPAPAPKTPVDQLRKQSAESQDVADEIAKVVAEIKKHV